MDNIQHFFVFIFSERQVSLSLSSKSASGEWRRSFLFTIFSFITHFPSLARFQFSICCQYAKNIITGQLDDPGVATQIKFGLRTYCEKRYAEEGLVMCCYNYSPVAYLAFLSIIFNKKIGMISHRDSESAYARKLKVCPAVNASITYTVIASWND